MKDVTESFCTSCDWHGDGEGITGCPICGQPITTLDSAEESNKIEEYPEDIIRAAEEDESL